jgi:anti-sigma B factor antagonist
MSFAGGKDDDPVVVDVGAQLISANRREFKGAVLEKLEQGARRFRLDFSRTRYVDSSGLGVLVSLSRQVRERGGELRIANLNDDLTLLFKRTKFDLLFRPEDGGDGPASAGVLAPVQPPPRSGGAEESASQGNGGQYE